jgi:predicted amidohydrolase YtcJ
VLGTDLFRVAPEEIHAVPVVLTMMDGRVTHHAPEGRLGFTE